MVQINDVIRRDSSRLIIRELGKPFALPDDESLVPALFHNGTYGIVDVKANTLVEPDEISARTALHESVVMPTIQQGLSEHVLHVVSQDARGKFTIKLHVDVKRPDELHRSI